MSPFYISSFQTFWEVSSFRPNSTEERFLLLGFSDWPSLQPVLFVLVLCYLPTLTDSWALGLPAGRHPRPHRPPHHFRCHLALAEAASP